MAKISVVVLAGTEAHSDLARVLNALALTAADGYQIVTF